MSALFVYRVTLTSRHPATNTPFFVNFECDAPSVDALTDMLNEPRVVKGKSLVTQKTAEDGVFEVLGRRPFALARSGVAHIELPTVAFIEFEEAANGN